MNTQFSVLIKRYLLSVLIVIAGIAMIIVSLKTNQDLLFTISAVNLLIGGALALLFSTGILNRNIVLVIGVICVGITIFIGLKTKDSVVTTIQHDLDYIKSERLYQYTLSEIRDIQRTYRTENGVYAPNFDVLKEFFENSKIQKVESMGSVPTRRLTVAERDALYKDKRALDQNMTEREAALLAAMGNPTNSPDLENFKRDTVFVYFKDDFLGSPTRQNTRKNLGLGVFDIEDLRYVPMTDPKEEWIFETRDAVPYLKEDTIATIYVYGKEAVSRFEGGSRKVVGFGNLQTNSDKGTWE